MDDCLMLNIAKEFYTHPAGRVVADGKYNGTTFREKVLRPKVEEALRSGRKLCVSLSGLMSFGSSFFEEAFGGIIREMPAEAQRVADTIVIDAGTDRNVRYKIMIETHIRKALSAV